MRSRRSRSFGVAGILGGFALGSATMYLLDVREGRRRRGRVRDLAVHVGCRAREVVGKGSRDLGHRVAGTVAELEHAFRREHPDDEVVAERVRSAIGRACSHPHAIEVDVAGGCVTLRGPILASESAEVCRRVARVRGVRDTDASGLECHANPEHVPSLQGSSRTNRRGAGRARADWKPATRVVGGVVGTALALTGLGLRGALGRAMTFGGAGLLARAVLNTPLPHLLGLGRAPQAVELHKTLVVAAPVDDVFAFFTRIENFPRFMQHVQQVRVLGDGRSHWVVEGPAGVPVHWDAEVTRVVPNQVFAWRTGDAGAVRHAGIARFERWDGGTRIDMWVSYQPIAGVVGHAIATLLGANPKRALDEDMLRFKSLIERGKTAAHGVEITREELRQ